ncbi:uncharacterized protein LOC123258511 isoform X2 [Cotesia glomerata]|uniref:uncharacterized protein LOC123258511 isoform X2 n=1 Tax=Cotesia glomerata TaxID=32391 RepID=UPI001D02D314|nr:uncharacterized protein LOC123258511 isoform X2 [Cotesia glomerata]
MCTIFKYLTIIFFLIKTNDTLAQEADDETPDIIATFRGPFEDSLQYSKDGAGICSATISCDLLQSPIKMFKLAYKEFKAIYKNQCSHLNSTQPERLQEIEQHKDSITILSENYTNIEKPPESDGANELDNNNVRRVLASFSKRPCLHRSPNNN